MFNKLIGTTAVERLKFSSMLSLYIESAFMRINGSDSYKEVSIVVPEKFTGTIDLESIKTIFKLYNTNNLKVNYLYGITEEEARKYINEMKGKMEVAIITLEDYEEN